MTEASHTRFRSTLMVPLASIVAVSPRNETTLPRMRTVWLVKESRYLALIRGVASEAILITLPYNLGSLLDGGFRTKWDCKHGERGEHAKSRGEDSTISSCPTNPSGLNTFPTCLEHISIPLNLLLICGVL